jgi:hypothetical protein
MMVNGVGLDKGIGRGNDRIKVRGVWEFEGERRVKGGVLL